MVTQTNILECLMRSRPNIKIGELKEINDFYRKDRSRGDVLPKEKYWRIFGLE